MKFKIIEDLKVTPPEIRKVIKTTLFDWEDIIKNIRIKECHPSMGKYFIAFYKPMYIPEVKEVLDKQGFICKETNTGIFIQ